MLRAAERELLRRGIEEWNEGLFFECHETLEDLWNVLDGSPKRAVQGVLQAAVGLLHGERGNFAGAEKLLADGIGKLEEPGAAEALGLSLDGLLPPLRACRRLAAEVLAARATGDGTAAPSWILEGEHPRISFPGAGDAGH